MIRDCVLFICVVVLCEGQFQYVKFSHRNDFMSTTPLPFPPCRADNIDCLRRGIRTFFYLMDSGYLGMTPVDPFIIHSVAVSIPNEQMSLLMRRANVTGARWTKLADRKFDLLGGKSGVTFTSDLHVTGEVILTTAARMEPLSAFITMDIQNVESNITYIPSGERRFDNDDYIVIGPERIIVRNNRIPTYFVQPNSNDAFIIDQLLSSRPSILDHLTNEITAALMHNIVDNFRLFANKISVKHYYEYF